MPRTSDLKNMKNNSPLKPDLKKITKILNLMSRFDAPVRDSLASAESDFNLLVLSFPPTTPGLEKQFL